MTINRAAIEQLLLEHGWVAKYRLEQNIFSQIIKELRKDGYVIEEKPDRYQLIAISDQLRSREFTRELVTEKIGHDVFFYDEVTSTQDIAKKMITHGIATEGMLIVSKRQTKGRGRLKREWHSEEAKGIWASLIVFPDVAPQKLPLFTLLTAVAISRTLEGTTGISPEIKWPNDLLVGGKKLCGILTELVNLPGQLPALIIGFGINVSQRQEDFPSELVEKATSLFIITKKEWDHLALLRSFCAQFEKQYHVYKTEGFAPIKSLWEQYCVSLGKTITAKTVTGDFTGEALGIDHEGALLLKLNDGHIERIYSADIEI